MIRKLLCLSALTLALPVAAAPAATLQATDYGVVDFGDQTPFQVTGTRCGKATARVVLTFGGVTVSGPRAKASGRAAAQRAVCTGVARVPDYGSVARAGWKPGMPIGVSLVSRSGAVPLRFLRFEVDAGKVVGGAPATIDAGDQDTGAGDKALQMNEGDVVALGRVNVRQLRSLGLRVCINQGADVPANSLLDTRQEPTPVTITVHQGSPTGPELVGPADVESLLLPTGGRLAAEGFGGCYRLVELPFRSRIAADAPELFLSVDREPIPGVFQVNSIDFDGTGAKLPAPRQSDPRGMATIFDGTSFAGWDQTGCDLVDHAATRLPATNPADITNCVMTYAKPVHDVILRLDLRAERFPDNGGIFMPTEIQIRQAGEYGMGGFFGEYAARAHKLDNFPDWTQMEIVQIGARYVVSVNGRTVTDHLASAGAPAPYPLRIQTQAEWSPAIGTEASFGNEQPVVSGPADWGRFWFRNIRLYQCTSAQDPVCVAAANARAGEVPAR